MSVHHETRPWVGATNPVPTRWAPRGRGEPVAQPATRGLRYLGGRFRVGKGTRRGGGAVAQRLTAKDALLLRRADGSVAATFSAGGSAPAEVARTAEEDQKRNGKGPARDRPLERWGDKGEREGPVGCPWAPRNPGGAGGIAATRWWWGASTAADGPPAAWGAARPGPYAQPRRGRWRRCATGRGAPPRKPVRERLAVAQDPEATASLTERGMR